MHLQALKTAFLVDCDYRWILAGHMTTTRKHDTTIGPDLLRRMPDMIENLLGDKGYADSDFREECRRREIEEQIKYKEHSDADEQANAHPNKKGYAAYAETAQELINENK